MSEAGVREWTTMAHLIDRIAEKIDALQALTRTRPVRDMLEQSADPKLRRIAGELRECESGLKDVVEGKVSYVT
jgi:hypothetical protein